MIKSLLKSFLIILFLLQISHSEDSITVHIQSDVGARVVWGDSLIFNEFGDVDYSKTWKYAIQWGKKEFKYPKGKKLYLRYLSICGKRLNTFTVNGETWPLDTIFTLNFRGFDDTRDYWFRIDSTFSDVYFIPILMPEPYRICGKAIFRASKNGFIKPDLDASTGYDSVLANGDSLKILGNYGFRVKVIPDSGWVLDSIYSTSPKYPKSNIYANDYHYAFNAKKTDIWFLDTLVYLQSSYINDTIHAVFRPKTKGYLRIYGKDISETWSVAGDSTQFPLRVLSKFNSKDSIVRIHTNDIYNGSLEYDSTITEFPLQSLVDSIQMLTPYTKINTTLVDRYPLYTQRTWSDPKLMDARFYRYQYFQIRCPVMLSSGGTVLKTWVPNPTDSACQYDTNYFHIPFTLTKDTAMTLWSMNIRPTLDFRGYNPYLGDTLMTDFNVLPNDYASITTRWADPDSLKMGLFFGFEPYAFSYPIEDSIFNKIDYMKQNFFTHLYSDYFKYQIKLGKDRQLLRSGLVKTCWDWNTPLIRKTDTTWVDQTVISGTANLDSATGKFTIGAFGEQDQTRCIDFRIVFDIKPAPETGVKTLPKLTKDWHLTSDGQNIFIQTSQTLSVDWLNLKGENLEHHDWKSGSQTLKIPKGVEVLRIQNTQGQSQSYLWYGNW